MNNYSFSTLREYNNLIYTNNLRIRVKSFAENVYLLILLGLLLDFLFFLFQKSD